MAVNTITTTTAANWIPQVWAPELCDASQAWVGLSSLVDRQYEDTLKVGNIASVPDVANPAVTWKSEDTTGAWANVTETLQNITVNKHCYVGFLAEDFSAVLSKYAIRETYTRKSTYSLMSTMEGDVTSGLVSCPDNFSQLVGQLGTDPTTDNLIEAKRLLDTRDVPEGDRFFYMSPGIHAALLKQDVFVSGDYGPTGAVSSGNVTKPVYGATVHVSSLAANNPSTAGQAYGWFCHKQGVALIMPRGPTVHGAWENLEIGWGVIVDIIFGFVERVILPKTLASTTPDDCFNVGVRGPA